MHHNETTILDARRLRQFGLLMAAFVPALLGIGIPLLKGRELPLWPWIIGSGFFAIAIVKPEGLRQFYKIWLRLGSVLGTINTNIVMTLVFYLMIMPLGLFRRIVLGSDALRLKTFRSSVDSYKIKPAQEFDPKAISRPF